MVRHPAHPFRAVVIVLTVAAILAGVSGRLFAQAEEPTAVVTEFYESLKANDRAAAAGLLVPWSDPHILNLDAYYVPVELAFADMPVNPKVKNPPIFNLQTFKVGRQTVDGDRATVRVDETYAIHGRPTKVAVDFILRDVKGQWRIDSSAMGARRNVTALDDAADAPRTEAAATAWNARYATWIRTQGLAAAYAVLVPYQNTPPAAGKWRRPYDLIACKTNMKAISTALEMYAVDNGGRYPTALSQLLPAYIRAIPTCPSAHADTYTSAYTAATEPLNTATIVCGGHHHAGIVPADFPRYNSARGFRNHP